MTPKKMIRLCNTALQKLNDLESLASYIPSIREANRFVYESMAAVRELKHIARLETAHAVTVEQAAHIQRILSRTDFLMSLVPKQARKELDSGHDDS